MSSTQIKILKDTPFNLAGDFLSLNEFRAKYSYICAREVTDSELVKYLIREHTFAQDTPLKGNVGAFFEVVEKTMDLPNDLIIEGIVYRKEMNGMYAKFLIGSTFVKEDAIGWEAAHTVRELFLSCRHRSLVWHATNNVNKKL